MCAKTPQRRGVSPTEALSKTLARRTASRRSSAVSRLTCVGPAEHARDRRSVNLAFGSARSVPPIQFSPGSPTKRPGLFSLADGGMSGSPAEEGHLSSRWQKGGIDRMSVPEARLCRSLVGWFLCGDGLTRVVVLLMRVLWWRRAAR